MLHRILLAIPALLILLSPVAFAEVSVAYVNATRLLQEAPQVAQIKERIRSEFSARDRRLVEMQKQIGVLEERLARGEGLTSEQQQRLQKDISARKLKFKHARDELEQDKQLRFSEEEERFSRIMHEVIAQVAQDRKLDLVLQSGAIWVSPRIDITQTVLERLRAMMDKKN